MNIQSRSCTENRLCIFNECMCRTRGFCFVHVCIRTLPLSSPRFRNIRSRALAAPLLSFVIRTIFHAASALRSTLLAKLRWCLEHTLHRKSNFNSVTTLDLTQQVLYDVRFSEIPFWFLFPFTLVINQNTYFFYFVTYPGWALSCSWKSLTWSSTFSLQFRYNFLFFLKWFRFLKV